MNTHEEIYELHPISAIELLGYAKNNIVEAKVTEDGLPEKYQLLLTSAYNILNTVQEYLYNN